MARAKVSVVIPTLNSCKELAACLGSLGEGLSTGLIREVIVTDGGSDDGTVDLANEAGAIVVSGDRSRGGQLRRGCASAKGDWLLVLHADTQLSDGWAETVIDRIGQNASDVGYFRLAYRAKGIAPRVVAAWANLRSRVFGLPYGDQGLLVRAPIYHAAQGYDDIPLMEDVALIRRLGVRPKALDAVASTSADKYLAQGWVKRGTLNILMLLRYFIGVDPKKLAKEYSGKAQS